MTYTEQDMDRWVKICMRLIEKFRGKLQEEYGSDIFSAIKMFDKLYEEQNAKMPLMISISALEMYSTLLLMV